MIFNSLDFAVFLPIIFFLYWFVINKNLKLQNLLLVVSSYIFYGWWDWRFLSLIIVSSLVDYIIGLRMLNENIERKRKFLLFLSLFVNIGLLGFFKYYNFFVESFVEAFTLLGNPIESTTLKIILPVGISFYTFQTLSYTIDVYKKKLHPTNNIIEFFAFVSFFPQLVAGPIERAINLLPQFSKKRVFNYQEASNGLRQILWGLFKKVVIADNCAEYANLIFNNSTDYSGSALLLGALAFTFQIYCDFSGYSDIAIGTARLFGFNLMKNFAFPYFSRDIAEFWRRWHISLSSWFRDYLYIPLGGSRSSTWKKLRNVFIIFIVSGFWHGSNWTFISWGLLNAIYFLPLLLLNRNRENLGTIAEGKNLPSFKELYNMIITFSLTVFAWVFFRADSVQHAFAYLSEIFSTSILSTPDAIPKKAVLFVFGFILIEWFGREDEYAIEKLFNNWATPFRWGTYYILIFIILYFSGKEQDFIYFQF